MVGIAAPAPGGAGFADAGVNALDRKYYDVSFEYDENDVVIRRDIIVSKGRK